MSRPRAPGTPGPAWPWGPGGRLRAFPGPLRGVGSSFLLGGPLAPHMSWATEAQGRRGPRTLRTSSQRSTHRALPMLSTSLRTSSGCRIVLCRCGRRRFVAHAGRRRIVLCRCGRRRFVTRASGRRIVQCLCGRRRFVARAVDAPGFCLCGRRRFVARAVARTGSFSFSFYGDLVQWAPCVLLGAPPAPQSPGPQSPGPWPSPRASSAPGPGARPYVPPGTLRICTFL